MAPGGPSASKQKRLAEKAAKQAAKLQQGDAVTSSSTPSRSVVGSATNTPLTSVFAANGTDDLTSIAKLQIATERSASGILVSDPKGRDIKIDSYTLSFHGRLLTEGAEIALHYGQRYSLLGENGSGKLTYPHCIGPFNRFLCGFVTSPNCIFSGVTIPSAVPSSSILKTVRMG